MLGHSGNFSEIRCFAIAPNVVMLMPQHFGETMPNTFAYIMIFAWPVLALIAFRRLPLPTAVAAAMTGGYLLLPTNTQVDLPLLPEFDKFFAISVAGLLMIAASSVSRGAQGGVADVLPGWLPRALWAKVCLIAIVAGTFMTVRLNTEPLIYGSRVIPGLSVYDAFSFVLELLMLLIPFLIARKVLASPDAQAQFLRVLVVAAALYAMLALFEVRMSPQLNRWVYGFFPHQWIQHVRGDGFRPLVFLQHGLRLSLFLMIAFLGALACARYLSRSRRPVFVALAVLLFFTLVLSKSLGPFMLALLFAPIVILAPARLQLLFAAAITAIVLAYPVLRANDLVPIDRLMSFAESVSPDRAQSFGTRINNENVLLEKANQKPMLGWGGWGRSRIYLTNGLDITISDGYWVITFGQGGWVLYLAVFGLLGAPVLLQTRRPKISQPDGVSIALTLMLTANLIDLMPNSGLTPLTWMLAGALTGRMEWGAAHVESETPVLADTPPPISPYAPVLRDPSNQMADRMGKDPPAEASQPALYSLPQAFSLPKE